jgi:hypothetical protein
MLSRSLSSIEAPAVVGKADDLLCAHRPTAIRDIEMNDATPVVREDPTPDSRKARWHDEEIACGDLFR